MRLNGYLVGRDVTMAFFDWQLSVWRNSIIYSNYCDIWLIKSCAYTRKWRAISLCIVSF